MPAYDMFSDLKSPRDFTNYTLFRGTTDWSQLAQFDNYETGYGFLVVVSIPNFMQKMADQGNAEIARLINSYRYIIEHEFKGIDGGLENMTSETSEVTNGYQSINFITKVNAPSATTISMRYNEKAGSILTRTHELFLRSTRDGGSGFKHYNGMITLDGSGGYRPEEASVQEECFSFLYINTDNTGMLIERAVYYVGCQPTTAELSIYNSEKGNVAYSEVSAEFTAFPLMGARVNARAKAILDWMHNSANNHIVTRDSWNYDYEGITSASGLGASSLTSNG